MQTQKNWQILYTFTKFVQYLPFFVQMCIILTTFVYLQCKLALQVQRKHIKIKNKKTKKKKKKERKENKKRTSQIE